MHRLLFPLAVLILAAGFEVQAQANSDPVFIYEAYYQVSPADMEAWNDQYFQYAVPLLTQLREEGKIQGWSHWQHQTGGSEYNVRFTVRTHDWPALGSFWSEYLERLQAATPADEWDASSRMIQAHSDEIWEVVEVNTRPGAEWAYMYAATYRYNFADMGEWNRTWNELAAPVIDQAMEEGLLGGWARLNHHTGGSHNYKVLYLFEDWDHIDDFFQRIMGRMAREHPEAAKAMGKMTMGHNDVIWVPTRRAANQ